MGISTRPYDPNQLQKLTRHMEENGPTIAAVGPNKPENSEPETAQGAPEPEQLSPTPETEEPLLAIKGLRKFLTSEGRSERRKARAGKADRKVRVAAYIGDRIANPRVTWHPKENIGWVGTHKLEVDDVPKPEPKSPREKLLDDLAKEEDFKTDLGKLGQTLFTSGGGSKKVNELRPASWSEISIDKRLEKQIQRERRFRNESRWLEKSYDSIDDHDHLLSRAEKRHFRSVKRRQRKVERKADRAKQKFDKIADSKDWRGRRAKKKAGLA